MCGLSGMIINANNGFTADNQAQFANLISLTQFRGGDSTGVVSIGGKSGRYSSLKVVGPPAELFYTKDWDKWYGQIFQNGKLVFNHGRAATRGKVTTNNAHPFLVKKPDKGEIVFMHNGTLHVGQQLEGMEKFDVDSEWLAHKLAELGPTETFGKVRGPIACMWWDSELKTFNVYRNADRPLYLATCKKTKNQYIQSEKESLMYLKYKFNLDYDFAEIEQFEVENHYVTEWATMGDWTKVKVPLIYPTAVVYPPTTHGNRTWRGGRSGVSLLGTDDDDATEAWWQGINNTQGSNAPAEFNGIPRSYDDDCAAIIEGSIIRVEFQPRQSATGTHDRITVHPHGRFIDDFVSPYKMNLKELSLADDGIRIHAKYYDTVTLQGWKHEFEPKFRNNPSATCPKEDNVVSIVPCITQPLARGQKTHWKSKGRLGKDKHYGVVGISNERHLVEYHNTVDGLFRVGDIVNVEPDTYIKRGGTMLEFRGGRLAPNQPDRYVEFFGFWHNLPKEAAEKYPFVQGRIKLIKLLSKEEHEIAGHYVHILIDNLIPGANPEIVDEETDSIVVVAADAEPTEILH